MTDILAAIDGALDSHAHTAAEVTGNPWPGRVPSLDEMLEAVFGPEDGADLPGWAWGALVPSAAGGESWPPPDILVHLHAADRHAAATLEALRRDYLRGYTPDLTAFRVIVP